MYDGASICIWLTHCNNDEKTRLPQRVPCTHKFHTQTKVSSKTRAEVYTSSHKLNESTFLLQNVRFGSILLLEKKQTKLLGSARIHSPISFFARFFSDAREKGSHHLILIMQNLLSACLGYGFNFNVKIKRYDPCYLWLGAAQNMRLNYNFVDIENYDIH